MRVLVTGASSGIGLAVCEQLRSIGHETCGVARRPCSLESRYIQADLRESISGALIEAIKWADATVLCAAQGEDQLLTLEPEETIAEIIAANLTSQLLLLRQCARLWLHRRYGHVIMISSVAARTGMTGLVAYSATKAGLEGATRAAARELGRFGIQVNCIAPGFIDTQMTLSMPSERREQLRRRTPLGRLGTPGDVAESVVHLLDTKWVTGQTFVVDGGFSA